MADPPRIDEWLAELTRVTETQPDGFTRLDLEGRLGIGERSASMRLRSLVRAGRVAFVGYRDALAIDGKRYRMPVYKPTGPAQ